MFSLPLSNQLATNDNILMISYYEMFIFGLLFKCKLISNQLSKDEMYRSEILQFQLKTWNLGSYHPKTKIFYCFIDQPFKQKIVGLNKGALRMIEIFQMKWS